MQGISRLYTVVEHKRVVSRVKSLLFNLDFATLLILKDDGGGKKRKEFDCSCFIKAERFSTAVEQRQHANFRAFYNDINHYHSLPELESFHRLFQTEEKLRYTNKQMPTVIKFSGMDPTEEDLSNIKSGPFVYAAAGGTGVSKKDKNAAQMADKENTGLRLTYHALGGKIQQVTWYFESAYDRESFLSLLLAAATNGRGIARRFRALDLPHSRGHLTIEQTGALFFDLGISPDDVFNGAIKAPETQDVVQRSASICISSNPALKFMQDQGLLSTIPNPSNPSAPSPTNRLDSASAQGKEFLPFGRPPVPQNVSIQYTLLDRPRTEKLVRPPPPPVGYNPNANAGQDEDEEESHRAKNVSNQSSNTSAPAIPARSKPNKSHMPLPPPPPLPNNPPVMPGMPPKGPNNNLPARPHAPSNPFDRDSYPDYNNGSNNAQSSESPFDNAQRAHIPTFPASPTHGNNPPPMPGGPPTMKPPTGPLQALNDTFSHRAGAFGNNPPNRPNSPPNPDPLPQNPPPMPKGPSTAPPQMPTSNPNPATPSTAPTIVPAAPQPPLPSNPATNPPPSKGNVMNRAPPGLFVQPPGPSGLNNSSSSSSSNNHNNPLPASPPMQPLSPTPQKPPPSLKPPVPSQQPPQPQLPIQQPPVPKQPSFSPPQPALPTIPPPANTVNATPPPTMPQPPSMPLSPRGNCPDGAPASLPMPASLPIQPPLPSTAPPMSSQPSLPPKQPPFQPPQPVRNPPPQLTIPSSQPPPGLQLPLPIPTSQPPLSPQHSSSSSSIPPPLTSPASPRPPMPPVNPLSPQNQTQNAQNFPKSPPIPPTSPLSPSNQAHAHPHAVQRHPSTLPEGVHIVSYNEVNIDPTGIASPTTGANRPQPALPTPASPRPPSNPPQLNQNSQLTTNNPVSRPSKARPAAFNGMDMQHGAQPDLETIPDDHAPPFTITSTTDVSIPGNIITTHKNAQSNSGDKTNKPRPQFGALAQNAQNASQSPFPTQPNIPPSTTTTNGSVSSTTSPGPQFSDQSATYRFMKQTSEFSEPTINPDAQFPHEEIPQNIKRQIYHHTLIREFLIYLRTQQFYVAYFNALREQNKQMYNNFKASSKAEAKVPLPNTLSTRTSRNSIYDPAVPSSIQQYTQNGYPAGSPTHHRGIKELTYVTIPEDDSIDNTHPNSPTSPTSNGAYERGNFNSSFFNTNTSVTTFGSTSPIPLEFSLESIYLIYADLIRLITVLRNTKINGINISSTKPNGASIDTKIEIASLTHYLASYESIFQNKHIACLGRKGYEDYDFEEILPTRDRNGTIGPAGPTSAKIKDPKRSKHAKQLYIQAEYQRLLSSYSPTLELLMGEELFFTSSCGVEIPVFSSNSAQGLQPHQTLVSAKLRLTNYRILVAPIDPLFDQLDIPNFSVLRFGYQTSSSMGKGSAAYPPDITLIDIETKELQRKVRVYVDGTGIVPLLELAKKSIFSENYHDAFAFKYKLGFISAENYIKSKIASSPDGLQSLSPEDQKHFHALTSLPINPNAPGYVDGWKIYDAESEYRRQGLPFGPNKFALVQNVDYMISPTYPSVLVVPTAMVNHIYEICEYRSRGRYPMVVYYHKLTNASLFRCAQPLVGLSNKASPHDVQLLSHIRKCNSSNDRILNIFDARPFRAAMANKLGGKGMEKMSHYERTKLTYLNIDNIHAMSAAYEKLLAACSPTMVDQSEINDYAETFSSTYLKKVVESKWLYYIALILTSAVRIVQMITEEKSSVGVHCSDGWDRTAQLTSLCMLLLDPYFRTLRGFCILIEKEWCSMGHLFQDRIGHGQQSISSQRSPVFIQFIDCVYQIMHQYPTIFEFNADFLVHIVESLFSCRYGTFLMNCERERTKFELSQTTISLWTELLHPSNRPLYVNAMYKPTPADHISYPDSSGSRLVLFEKLHLRYTPHMRAQMTEIISHPGSFQPDVRIK